MSTPAAAAPPGDDASDEEIIKALRAYLDFLRPRRYSGVLRLDVALDRGGSRRWEISCLAPGEARRQRP